MIRVIYRWKVQDENRGAFRSAWEKVTTTIRANTHGARGSVLMESCDDPTEFVTIAHWDRLDQWQSFIDMAPQGHMQDMHRLADLVSREAFRQIGDHTI